MWAALVGSCVLAEETQITNEGRDGQARTRWCPDRGVGPAGFRSAFYRCLTARTRNVPRAGRTSWTHLPDAVRLDPDDDATEVTAAPIRDLMTRLVETGT
jgi:hypothetical protein